MMVLAVEAPGDLVGMRFADEPGAGIQQQVDDGRARHRYAVAAEPVRTACSRRHAGHVEEVLDREGEAGERPAGLAFALDAAMCDERAEYVVDGHDPPLSGRMRV